MHKHLKTLFSIAAVAAFCLGFAHTALHAMDREQAFNDAVRQSRCATGNFPAGYCIGTHSQLASSR